MNSTPELLKLKEIAKLLGLSVPTVRKLVKEGKIPGAIRLGFSTRFNADIFINWLNSKPIPS